jgi:cytochrome c peroxidase
MSRGVYTLLAFLASTLLAAPLAAQELTPLEQLGKFLLFDENLSTPFGQSCTACHGPQVGYTGPNQEINAHGAVYPGAVHTRFGNRKPPTIAYAGDSPVLHYDEAAGSWVGGMFWDGRATGATLGDPLAEQAQGPFLNPLEQNNPNAQAVVFKVARSAYADLFREVWGADSLPPLPFPIGVSGPGGTASRTAEPAALGSASMPFDIALAYERIARSIAAYERSLEVSAYSSKYDYWLAGMATLTEQEELGRQLFNDPLKGNCAACHISAPGPAGQPPLFTDYTYDNLGVPRNPENPFYSMPRKWNPLGADWVDYGLGGFLKNAGFEPDVYTPELGKEKVPTLRNVDLRPTPDFVKAFGHNGFFKSLEEIVHFYNTRDVETWPPPEVSENLSTELGNLGLTPEEEAAIVAFMRTLSDGYVP